MAAATFAITRDTFSTQALILVRQLQRVLRPTWHQFKRSKTITNLRHRLGLIKRALSHMPAQDLPVADSSEISFEKLSKELGLVLDEMRVRWRQEDEILQFLGRRARAQVESNRLERDRTEAMVHKLDELRLTSSYLDPWVEQRPLVSVRIASYQNTDALMNVAIPSVFAQSYANWELIVVNDGPNPRTREAVQSIDDSRVKYLEFNTRSQYPSDPHLRWLVAGSPGMNKGAELATGKWIAPLDDDDEFTPDHIERLLDLARSSNAEFVYGKILQRRIQTNETVEIFSDPPEPGQISMQSAIYHEGLRFFSYDVESWRSDEPGDWNLIRRMRDAGVRLASTSDVVTTVHMVPFQSKTNG